MNIEKALSKHEVELLRLPNVVGVGKGEKDGKAIIQVLVTHKIPRKSLKPDEVIPQQLEGYEVSVEEIGVPQIQKPNED